MPTTRKSYRDLRLAGICICLAMFVLGVRLFLWQGLFTTVRVSGGSMAESYLGEHVNLQCSRCQLNFCADLGPWQHRSKTICPNCQQSLDETHAVAQTSGQRVLIDQAAYWFAGPARFEVIAMREPKTDDLAMKRVIALPNEHWEFRRGDLLVNDQLVRKTMLQYLETAVLVHDDRHRVSATTSRWRAEEASSQWQMQATGFTLSNNSSKTTGQGRGVEWLVYHHLPQHPAAQVDETCVKDLDAYNSTLARPLQPVTDLIVQGEFQLAASSVLHFRIHDGYETRELLYRPKKNATQQTQTFSFGLCDRTLWLMVDGAILERKELNMLDEPPHCISQPLAIGGAGEGSIVLKNLRISRDIHYLAPNGLTDTWQPERALGANEFAILGDNPPLSIDSRHWQGIERKRIVGSVLKW